MRFIAPIFALLLATSLVAPVLADPGNGNGNGNGGGNSQGAESSGNSNAGSGNNNGNGNGNGNAGGQPGEKAKGKTATQVTKVPKDEKVAREAVKNRQVLCSPP